MFDMTRAMNKMGIVRDERGGPEEAAGCFVFFWLFVPILLIVLGSCFAAIDGDDHEPVEGCYHVDGCQ